MQSQPADSLRADSPFPESSNTEPRIPRDPDPREVLDDDKRRCQDRALCREAERQAACHDAQRHRVPPCYAIQDDCRATDLDHGDPLTPTSSSAVPPQPAPYPFQPDPARTPELPPAQS